MASLRTHLLSALLRATTKRDMARRPFDPRGIRRVRARLERLERHCDAPSGVRFEPTTLGGVAGEWTYPRELQQPRKALLYLHGGGYVVGSARLYRRLTWRLAEAACARVAAIDYRLAPNHPYPAQAEDALAAYNALLGCGFEARDLAVVGDSAGGNLALQLLLRLQCRGEPQPAAAVCFSPWTDICGASRSLRYNRRREALLAGDRLRDGMRLIAPGTDCREPLLSPVYADLSGLPPLAVHVGSHEILLDDATRLTRAARAAGVEAHLHIWDAQPHAFPVFARWLPEGRAAIADCGRFLLHQWLTAAELRRLGEASPRHAIA